MPEVSFDEIFTELGAEPLDGSGFEAEEPEVTDEDTNVEPEVAE